MALGAMMLAMAGVIGLQVVARYGFNHSLFWSEELGRALLVWLTFLGASSAYAHGLHVGVDTVAARLGRRAKWLAELTAVLAGLFLFGLMAWAGTEYAFFLGAQRTAGLGVSKAWVFLAVPISGAVAVLHGLARLAGLVASAKGARGA